MKAVALSFEDAGKKLGVELIKNGRGTQALHETVVGYQAARRAGTHSVKTKGTVKKTGKKPWRQKGTGRARAGYFASPVWRGGGVVFGPHPRDYTKAIPKRVKRLALNKAISERIKKGEVLVVSEITVSNPKTKELLSQIGSVKGEGSILLVVGEINQNLYLASRNHPEVAATTGDLVNAEDILRYDKVILTEAALEKISNRLKG
jgi:large subunit ribosomal protein L4